MPKWLHDFLSLPWWAIIPAAGLMFAFVTSAINEGEKRAGLARQRRSLKATGERDE